MATVPNVDREDDARLTPRKEQEDSSGDGPGRSGSQDTRTPRGRWDLKPGNRKRKFEEETETRRVKSRTRTIDKIVVRRTPNLPRESVVHLGNCSHFGTLVGDSRPCRDEWSDPSPESASVPWRH